jgi:putative phosphoribosyl transferase
MSTVERRGIRIALHAVGLLGADLTLARSTGPLVVFAHGSGSSRHSPRNKAVAQGLNAHGLGTLLLDLLTDAEEAVEQRGGRLRFDVDELANRLVGSVGWVMSQPDVNPAALGYFGASTGAAGALVAAARQREQVGAVVSRSGRPDLAGECLPLVTAPTLLIVGSHDPQVRRLNEQALEQLRCDRHLEVVPGASHLFEEPGALDRVSELTADWFTRHLGSAPP